MIAFKPPLIVQRAEDDKTQSSAEFLAHCCSLSKRGIDRPGHAQAGHTQSRAKFLAVCCHLAKGVTDQTGHAKKAIPRFCVLRVESSSRPNPSRLHLAKILQTCRIRRIESHMEQVVPRSGGPCDKAEKTIFLFRWLRTRLQQHTTANEKRADYSFLGI